jgi:hypothetical protein
VLISLEISKEILKESLIGYIGSKILSGHFEESLSITYTEKIEMFEK